MIIALQTLIFFRESLFTVIDHFLKPYYEKLTSQFKEENSDDDSDDHVYAEYDDEKGVVFYPPVYAQRYAAVTDCLMDERWNGMLEKVVDFGYHDMSFIKYLKDVPGVKNILGVDLETIPLRCSSDLLRYCDNNVLKREGPIQITLFQGNAADPDYRLIGSDAVVAIEMIEHMLPHDLERFVHTVFGFIKPRVAIITTPNGDFNILFKALEKNGLRRLDHFFEWSREQFSDWCGNIVARYPQYTVTCKGIGPGPVGTAHLGCCSQLALFVSEDYQKWQDLTLDSLALVAKQPSPASLANEDGWQSPDGIDNTLLCIENSVKSYTELLLKQQSYMTIILTSPSFSLETREYADKMLQCNLEFELEKNFLMFDDEVYCKIVIPRRKKVNKVYVIEDVASRLNCSTVQVKKFSKATQNLLAKNKMDSFAYTREVVDEIKNLTKMLNVNKSHRDNELHDGNIWCNINWGEDAPYWNQYYKIVREYRYPLEMKTEECRILDTISEEINKLVDLECEEFSVNANKQEIPIDHLMSIVEHITTDVDKVKELLEWNGYEIVDDVLIYPLGVLENKSDPKEDWQETDTLSDWGTNEVRSTSVSDGSTSVPDVNDRYLRRALDKKILRLQSITSENLATELDRVVCRLMKLALYTCKGKQTSLPSKWMQKKLFDLLTLTEKAIDKRRRLFVENFTFKSIEYHIRLHYKVPGETKSKIEEITNVSQNKMENVSGEIMLRYQHLIEQPDVIDETPNFLENPLEESFDDDSITSNECKDYEYNVAVNNENDIDDTYQKEGPSDIQFNYSQNTDHNNFESVPYFGSFISIKSSNDESKHIINDKTDTIASDKKIIGRKINSKSKLPKVFKHKSKFNKCSKASTTSRTRQRWAVSKGSKFKLIKHYSAVSIDNKNKRKIKIKKHEMLQSKLARPIPDSLINLCDLENDVDKIEITTNTLLKKSVDTTNNLPHITSIAITEATMLLAIVSESGEEIIALRRNTGTDPDCSFENDVVSETVINITNDCFNYAKVDNVQSDTIFLNDINEPSTSKGNRKLSTDVQCGPDNSLCALSLATSFTKLPNMFNYGIRIEDSSIQCIHRIKKTCDFGMCTDSSDNMIDAPRNIGIKIKDSNPGLCCKNDCHAIKNLEEKSVSVHDIPIKTTLSKPEIEDYDSEFCCSLGSLQKSQITNSKDTSESQIQHVNHDNFVRSTLQAKHVTQRLVCGGIHVHSFKDKLMVSEDVVYQGEWQQTPKIVAKKLSSEFANKKRAYVQKRRQLCKKSDNSIPKNSGTKEMKRITKRTTSTKSQRENDMKKKPKNVGEQQKTNFFQKKPKNMEINKNVVRVFSKVTMRTHMINDKSKSIKIVNSKKTTKVLTRTEIETQKGIRKNYLPPYLRRRLKNILENKKSVNKLKNSSSYEDIKNMIQSANSDEITKDLLKLSENMPNNNYIVFRNGIETQKSIDNKLPLSSEQNNNNSLRRSYSPQSQNSSTCSSPNSVATVRATKIARNRVVSNQKDSTSERSSSGLELDNISWKYKYLKRCKMYKRSPAVCNNKENIPQSSKNISSFSDGKNFSKTIKNIGRTKSIYMVQPNDNPNVQSTSARLTKNTTNKCIKLLDSKNNCLKKDLKNADRSMSNLNSINNNDQYCAYANNSFHIACKNNKLAVNSIKDESLVDSEINNITSYKIQTTATSQSPAKSLHNTTSSIMSTIRLLLEDKIKMTENNSQETPISGSETVIINRRVLDNSNLSPLSKTVINNDDICEFGSELENSYISATKTTDENESVVSFTGANTSNEESDAFSFKSLESTTISKFSEYYLADNELENTLLPENGPIGANIVQNIFERNSQNKNSNIAGLLEGFSGFSVNAEPFPGDQVNLIDSETGNLAIDSARLTASEELLLSGRTSDTYASCFYDDDAYVPNWLFDATSEQQSIEESALEEPLEVPLFDINDNTIEPGVGVTSGAGDGRGIHSDHSQDSSGRGTSLSSTASSGPENEAILLVDLSAVAAYGPLNVTTANISSDALDIPVRNEVFNENNVNAHTRNVINPAQIGSDGEADVSSVDTDAIDSDNT